jgi:hypothetical protein
MIAGPPAELRLPRPLTGCPRPRAGRSWHLGSWHLGLSWPAGMGPGRGPADFRVGRGPADFLWSDTVTAQATSNPMTDRTSCPTRSRRPPPRPVYAAGTRPAMPRPQPKPAEGNLTRKPGMLWHIGPGPGHAASGSMSGLGPISGSESLFELESFKLNQTPHRQPAAATPAACRSLPVRRPWPGPGPASESSLEVHWK